MSYVIMRAYEVKKFITYTPSFSQEVEYHFTVTLEILKDLKMRKLTSKSKQRSKENMD